MLVTTVDNVFRVTQSIMYGAYMLGQSLVYAPSFKSAVDCGARIISLIHREPKVKTESGVKDKKDWVKAAKTGQFNILVLLQIQYLNMSYF